MSRHDLSGQVRRLQDALRKDHGIDGDAERIAQLTWMLFLKSIDSRLATTRDPILRKLRWREWASAPRLRSNEELLEFVSNFVFGEAAHLLSGSDSGLRQLVSLVLGESENRTTSAEVLAELIDRIDSLPVWGTAPDVGIGAIYENILSDLQNAGNAGEFYTPRGVTDFIVEMLDPRPGEIVADPACGTGGFLISAAAHLRRNVADSGDIAVPLPLVLRGVEKKKLPHLLCLTNLSLHGIDPEGSVMWANALERSSPIGAGTVDVVATNPPFGASEEPIAAERFGSRFRSRETADLFVLLVMEILKPGGRAAIVLPDGFLFGSGVKESIRQHLLAECDLHTILRLPAGVFSPYTSIPTNVLFFRKAASTKSVWYFEHHLPVGFRSYTKTRPIRSDHFSPERAWWDRRRSSPQAWRVTVAELRRGAYNLDRRNPRKSEETERDLQRELGSYVRQLDHLVQARSALTARLGSLLQSSRSDVLSRVVENLECFSQVPSDMGRLRLLLLRLAMQGRLLPQDDEDEPASELLLKIDSTAQSSLFASSAPSLPKESPVVDAPFSVPASWAWVELRRLGRVVGGGTPKATDSRSFADHGTPWLTPADLGGNRAKRVASGRRFLTDWGLKNSSAVLLPEGTVLFSSRAPIGYVAIAGCQLATNQGFKSCVPHVKEMSDFLYYALREAGRRIDRAASGTTFKEISGREMARVAVPVPPLAEQRRIVDLLDQLLKLCDELEDAITRAGHQQQQLSESLLP